AYERDHGQPEAFPEGIGHADGKPGRGKRKAVVRKPDQREHGYKPRIGAEEPAFVLGHLHHRSPAHFKKNGTEQKKPMLHMRYRRHKNLRRLEAHTREQSAATPE